MMRVTRSQADDEAHLSAVLRVFAFRRGATAQPEFLANPHNCFLVASIDDAPVGCLFGYELPRPESPRPLFFLYSIDVLEPFRRRGIARALVEAFIDLCQQHDGEEVFALTARDNLPVINLYQSTGGKHDSNPAMLFVYNFED